jgi:hypothetical protein
MRQLRARNGPVVGAFGEDPNQISRYLVWILADRSDKGRSPAGGSIIRRYYPYLSALSAVGSSCRERKTPLAVTAGAAIAREEVAQASRLHG